MVSHTDRRRFIKKSGATILTGSMLFNINTPMHAHASGNKTLRVGLIGCGGRGSGAADQALTADPDVILTAMGDVFSDRLEESYQALKEIHPMRVQVDPTKRFIGFDAFMKVINSDVDVVLLATPPAFRPDHMVAAIRAGKHVFAEKPVAIDAPGVRKVLEASRLAKEKNLSVVSGFCFRYDAPKRALFQKILKGEIGEVRSVSTMRNGGLLWNKPRQAAWTDMEYQLRNWLYHTWLSGDFITEMMVHSLDMMSWAFNDVLPVRATGTGGRQVRTEAVYGNAYDHFAIEFEYPNGARAFHFSRQQDGCSSVNKVDIIGTNGNAYIGGDHGHEVHAGSIWKYDGLRNNMYQTEQDELFASIRNGKPMNDGNWMAQSSMLGVLSRMVAYTGQTITYADALKSDVSLAPPIDQYAWDLKWPGQPVSRPGIDIQF
jgi:myo-inositol 2-dehydrogenase/D-chiro-inositol 1-dehydrogenase